MDIDGDDDDRMMVASDDLWIIIKCITSCDCLSKKIKAEKFWKLLLLAVEYKQV